MAISRLVREVVAVAAVPNVFLPQYIFNVLYVGRQAGRGHVREAGFKAAAAAVAGRLQQFEYIILLQNLKIRLLVYLPRYVERVYIVAKAWSSIENAVYTNTQRPSYLWWNEAKLS